ncbi:MAG: type IV pilus biogenesis protein PilM [Gammaproteobacteria bacterium]
MLLRLMQLSPIQNEIIGLDIGSDFIKLLKINNKTSPKLVEKYAIAPLPSGAIIKSEIKEPNIVAQILKKTLEETRLKTEHIVLAITRSSTIIKNITIDSRLTPDELETRVYIEAKHQFPDLIGDSYLDYTIIGKSPKDEAQLEVILVACRKNVIDSYISLLNLAGVAPKAVDVNSFAFERALLEIANSAPECKTVALLNLDTSLSTLIVLHDKKLIYAHDESFDAHRLLTQLNEAKNDVEKQQTILKENLSTHLRHAMNFFYSTRSHFNIEKLFVSGDCTKDFNLSDFIHNETGLDTCIADPFSHMQISPEINATEFKKSQSELVLCAGLALYSLETEGL